MLDLEDNKLLMLILTKEISDSLGVMQHITLKSRGQD